MGHTKFSDMTVDQRKLDFSLVFDDIIGLVTLYDQVNFVNGKLELAKFHSLTHRCFR